MKKILIAIFVIIILAVGFFAVQRTSTTYLKNKEKETFIQSATAYLEQRYNIKITECIDYSPADIGYHAPALGIDGGYFTNAAEHGTFVDSTGKKIVCTCRNGILSDDYKLEELYKNFYEYISAKLGIDVKYIGFDNCGYETVYVDNWDNEVGKDIDLFLEHNEKDYPNLDADIFFTDLLNYFDEGNMNIYAYINEGTDQEMLMENTERFWNGTDLHGVYVHIYDKSIDLDIRRTPDNTMYSPIMASDYLYKYDYYVICNYTGTRIQENDK